MSSSSIALAAWSKTLSAALTRAVSRIWKAIQSQDGGSATEAASTAPKAAKKAERAPKAAKKGRNVRVVPVRAANWPGR